MLSRATFHILLSANHVRFNTRSLTTFFHSYRSFGHAFSGELIRGNRFGKFVLSSRGFVIIQFIGDVLAGCWFATDGSLVLLGVS